jgi:hypothetical protein
MLTDPVQVKEQKAKKGLYIDNGPVPRGGFTMDWRNGQDRAKPILLFHMLMAFVIYLQNIKGCLNLVQLIEFDIGYILVTLTADLTSEQKICLARLSPTEIEYT